MKNWAFIATQKKRAGINTNMSLERMHRPIKYIDFKAKKMKRLDKSINLGIIEVPSR